MTANKINGAVAQSPDGWWVAQIGVDWVSQHTLERAGNENTLLGIDGVVGRFATEAEAESQLALAIEQAESE